MSRVESQKGYGEEEYCEVVDEMNQEYLAILASSQFPLKHEKQTIHLGVLKGQVANRILSVGDSGRALRIARLLDEPQQNLVVKTDKDFTTYTGTFRGIPVSIIATGMGVCRMDLVVKEATYFAEGETAIVRLGTSGILKDEIAPGSVIISKSSRMIQQNYDYEPSSSEKPYFISRPKHSDLEMYEALKNRLHAVLGPDSVAEGVNITGDSFYNSQGRIDQRFEDHNEDLLTQLKQEEPDAASLEMETFKLLDLASRSKGKIKACACVIGCINRFTEKITTDSVIKDMEYTAGIAVLQALAQVNLA